MKITRKHWFLVFIRDWFFWPSLALTAFSIFCFALSLTYQVSTVLELSVHLGSILGSMGFAAIGMFGLLLWVLVSLEMG